MMQILFLGTGSSIESPSIRCLVREDGCLGCKTALTTEPKNKRRQTSTVFRIPQDDGTFRNILIDCGASTYAAIIEHFPKHGIDKIDALILTHSHNDAIGGLDALTSFVTRSDLQEHMDIYCTATVQQHILGRIVPFFGARPDIWRFRTFQEGGDSLELFGCPVTVIPVEHGAHSGGQAYISNGFIFNQKVVYISDVSYIPENTLQTIQDQTAATSGPDLLIIDCLQAFPIKGHFSVPQSVNAARQMNAKQTFLTQMKHGITHEAFEAFSAALLEGRASSGSTSRLAGSAMKDSFATDYYLHWTAETTEGQTIALHEIPNWQSIPRGLGIDDHDTEALVELFLQQLEEWEGGQQPPIRVDAAYDGLFLEVQ